MLSHRKDYAVFRKALKMAIEAPVSRFKRTNLKIYIIVCIIFAIWFGYDGYFNKKFIEKNTDENGNPNSTLVFNQKAPPFLIGGAVLLASYLFIMKDKKLIADEKELIFSGKFGDKKRILYDSIERIDKTYFETKGYFFITYKNEEGKETDLRISDRTYDKLTLVLDHLVTEIS